MTSHPHLCLAGEFRTRFSGLRPGTDVGPTTEGTEKAGWVKPEPGSNRRILVRSAVQNRIRGYADSLTRDRLLVESLSGHMNREIKLIAAERLPTYFRTQARTTETEVPARSGAACRSGRVKESV